MRRSKNGVHITFRCPWPCYLPYDLLNPFVDQISIRLEGYSGGPGFDQIQCEIRENTKFLDRIQDLTTTQEEGLAKILAGIGKQNHILGQRSIHLKQMSLMWDCCEKMEGMQDQNPPSRPCVRPAKYQFNQSPCSSSRSVYVCVSIFWTVKLNHPMNSRNI